MAFYKVRRRRFAARRKRKYGKVSTRIPYWNIGAQIFNDVKRLKSLINVEFKRYDSDTGYIIPVTVATAAPSLLTTIAQGDGVSSRDGNSIRLKSILMRMNVYRALNAGPGTPRAMTRFRCILFQGIYNNNALPSTADILQTPTQFHSPLNADESTGYRILHDKIYQVTADKPSVNPKWYLRLNHHAKYSGTSAAISDTTSGQLFFLVFVDDATNGDAITVNTRIRFIDN